MTQHHRLTEAQEAMLEHLAYLNYSENKPARWQDFALFQVNNKEYKLKYGTIRNNFSYLKRIGKLVRQVRSINSYYVLAEYAMTSDHTSVTSPQTPLKTRRTTNKDLLALIDDMPFDTPGLHNIRLVFPCQGIWDKAKTLLQANNRSKDLVLPAIKLEQGVKALVTIHKTNNVSVILDCSESPIILDPRGLIQLNNSFVHVQERLKAIMIYEQLIDLPEPNDWFVTMQHYGRDSLQIYRGKSFDITLKDYNNEFLHTYFKKVITA
jgi:hypothetical protein